MHLPTDSPDAVCKLLSLKQIILQVNVQSKSNKGTVHKLYDKSRLEFYLQWMWNGSSVSSTELSPWVETQVKTAPTSSLVAVYWRMEEVVNKPVGGSTLRLGEMTTAAGGRGNSVAINRQSNKMLWYCRVWVPPINTWIKMYNNIGKKVIWLSYNENNSHLIIYTEQESCS